MITILVLLASCTRVSTPNNQVSLQLLGNMGELNQEANAYNLIQLSEIAGTSIAVKKEMLFSRLKGYKAFALVMEDREYTLKQNPFDPSILEVFVPDSIPVDVIYRAQIKGYTSSDQICESTVRDEITLAYVIIDKQPGENGTSLYQIETNVFISMRNVNVYVFDGSGNFIPPAYVESSEGLVYSTANFISARNASPDTSIGGTFEFLKDYEQFLEQVNPNRVRIEGSQIIVYPPMPIIYSLTIEASPTEGGDVSFDTSTWSDNDHCSVTEGTEIAFYARVKEGYNFIGWYDGENMISSELASSLVLGENKILLAKFEVITVSSIEITTEDGTKEVRIGKTKQLITHIQPENALDKTITWTIENLNEVSPREICATITQAGLLTCLALGNILVIASAGDGSGVQGFKEITVTNSPQLKNPLPENNAQQVPKDIDFSWEIDNDQRAVLGYDFYFGTSQDNLQKLNGELLTSPSFTLEGVDYNTSYYWQVRAVISNDGIQEEIISSVWNFKTSNTLEIHIIATQEDMNKGYFFIEFQENPKEITNRTYTFCRDTPLYDVLTIIESQEHQTGNTHEDNSISFITSDTKNNKYGYRINPIGNQNGFSTGFCDENIGIWDLYYTFPRLNTYLWDNILVVFDVPEEMNVYASWELYDHSKNGRAFQVFPSPYERPYLDDYHFWVCTWGNFHSEQITTYYDEKNLVLLGYETNTDTYFELADFMFGYAMQAFENALELMPKNTIIVILDSESPYYGGEGVGGYYLPNWMGDTIEPIRDPNAGNEISLDSPITLAYPNIGGLSTTAGHCVIHTNLVAFVDDWWPIEGIATYYQLYFLRLQEWFTQEMYEEGWKLHIDFYHNYVIPNEYDWILQGTGNVYPPPDHDQSTWIAYIKGGLFFYTIDQIIRETTGNELIDFMKFYIEGITGDNQYRIFSYDWFIESLTEYTGKDFQLFFDKFVFDKQPLPIRVIEDTIVIEEWNPSMVRVNRGTFMMGDETDDLREECSPSHQVTLTYDYLIGK